MNIETRRDEPCSKCGQPVLLVKTYSDEVTYGHGDLVAESARHDADPYLGERVDGECNNPYT